MSLSSRRAAAILTVLGLSGLGGIALESNNGIPPQGTVPTAGGRAGSPPIVTSASGGGGAINSIPVATARSGTTAPRIVTRASGAPAFAEREEE